MRHLQESLSGDAATIQRLEKELADAQAVIDSFEEQAANQVCHCTFHQEDLVRFQASTSQTVRPQLEA